MSKVTRLVAALLYKGTYLRNVKRWIEYPRDPSDEPFLNLAIEVQADYLISRDPDLLDLMKWDKEAGREFQQRFRFLKIVTPEVFLTEIEARIKQP
jgi:predicted nucleic acid-binding protein